MKLRIMRALCVMILCSQSQLYADLSISYRSVPYGTHASQRWLEGTVLYGTAGIRTSTYSVELWEHDGIGNNEAIGGHNYLKRGEDKQRELEIDR